MFSCGQRDLFRLSMAQPQAGNQYGVKITKCVVKMSYRMVKTFFFLSENRQKEGRQESKAGKMCGKDVVVWYRRFTDVR